MVDTSKFRTQTRVATYLLGYRGESILLAKRQNVSFMNEMWSLVAGHVYERESAAVGMAREFEEECGAKLDPKSLEVAGVMYSISGDFDYVNIVYKADLTGVTLENKEPEKCSELKFHPLSELPSPMADFIVDMIERSSQGGLWFCENKY